MELKNLIPWRSNDPFASLQKEMNRLFEEFETGSPLLPGVFRNGGAFAPKIDVAETEKEIQVTAELPGMSEKDVEVSFNDNVLVIKGEKKDEKEEKNRNYYRTERVYGSFQRMIPVPSEIAKDRIDASFSKGVLKVTLPKTEKAQKETRKIEVKAG